MTDDRALELWGRYLSGESLTEEERGELTARLEADAEFRQLALTDFETHGLLRSSNRVERDADSFAHVVGKYVAKEREATGFAKKVQSRIHETRVPEEARSPRPRRRATRGERSRPFPWGIALAAGMVAVILVFLAVSAPAPSGPDERETARRPKAAVPREAQARDEVVREAQERAVQAQAERERLEKALSEREEERWRLSAAQKEAVDERTQSDLKEREKELERIAAEYKAKVEALREQERDALTKAAPAAPQNPAETRPAKPGTETAAARVARVEGEAYLVVKGVKLPAAPGQEIGSGLGIETRGANSYVEIGYPDRTRLEIGADTEVREIHEAQPPTARGKRLVVAKGTVRAEVAKQPKDLAMVVLTPHAESTVLGTTLRITVGHAEKAFTRLEVEEGKVRLKRLSDGKAVEVASGHSAVAASGLPLAVQPIAEDDIVLSARRGKSFGPEWKPVRDDLASTGFAWESGITAYRPSGNSGAWLYPTLKNRASYVEFQFFAAGNKAYHVWVRGRTPAVGKRTDNDEVGLGTPDGSFEPRCPFVGRHGADGFILTGFADYPAYGWHGGTDEAKGPPSQAVVRFSRTGLQTLRLYAVECPMRIDAIWLSTSQKAKPDPDQRGGEARK